MYAPADMDTEKRKILNHVTKFAERTVAKENKRRATEEALRIE